MQIRNLNLFTCHACKKVFTDMDSKILCCNRCNKWFCISCVNVTDACYKFLASDDAEDITLYCRDCKIPAKSAVIEDRSTEDRCKKYTKELNQKIRTIETTLQKKADITKPQKLQQKWKKMKVKSRSY